MLHRNLIKLKAFLLPCTVSITCLSLPGWRQPDSATETLKINVVYELIGLYMWLVVTQKQQGEPKRTA
jgi:hypothetical protein